MLSVVQIPDPPKRGRGRPPLTEEQKEARRLARSEPQKPVPSPSSVPKSVPGAVEQVREAFTAGSRLSAFVGLVLGGFVPLATFTIIHTEVHTRPELWALVAGGLVYSAISVYSWAVKAFRYWAKAAGFVLLLEGTLTFCHVLWLAVSGLLILMILNGASAAVVLQTDVSRIIDNQEEEDGSH